MLQWLYKYVASVCSTCFICFRHILQVFHLNVAKADLDVAYTCMLQAFVSSVLEFHMYVASVSSGCCICFTMATHVFS
jgi:hypothetical protein